MSNAANNGLHNVSMIGNKNVYHVIRTFLDSFAKESPNTAEAYERDIKLFFEVAKNKKDIKELSMDDIKLELPDLTSYQTLLQNSGKYKNSSIRRKIEAVRSLYNFFKASDFDVNPFVFKSLKKLRKDTKNIDIISPDEAKVLKKLALKEKHDGFEKSVLIDLAASTSIRKDAILEVKYEHIVPHPTKQDVFLIDNDELFDKGEMVYKEIHKEMYQRLIALKSDKQKDGDIFTVSYHTLTPMIKRLYKQAGFDTRRDVSWHSLRKTGSMLVDELTNGDMTAITAQGGWSSPEVAYDAYIGKQRKFNMAGVAWFEDIDEEIFDKLTRNEMLVLLKSFGNGFGMQLKRKAQEIVDNRKGR